MSAEERTAQGLKSAVPAGAKIIGKVKAVYEYTAVNREEEIDLLEGDIIAVEFKASWSPQSCVSV